MLIIVTCNNCGGEGRLPITLKMCTKQHICETCCNIDNEERTFRFCCKKCLDEWLEKNKEGFSCNSCEGTGWMFGYKRNGKCPSCDKGIIKWGIIKDEKK